MYPRVRVARVNRTIDNYSETKTAGRIGSRDVNNKFLRRVNGYRARLRIYLESARDLSAGLIKKSEASYQNKAKQNYMDAKIFTHFLTIALIFKSLCPRRESPRTRINSLRGK
jgi:hypothetical protein